MEQNTASETDSCSANQEIPAFYGTHRFITELCTQQPIMGPYS
jgi:hypothetical protein